MTRIDFLDELNIRLASAGVPDAKELLSFYDESIRDRMDSGMSEAQAVADVGNIDEIVRNAKAEMPMPLVVRDVIASSHREAKSNGRLIVWIVLILLFAPALFSIVSGLFGVYIALWGVVFGFFVADVVLIGAGGIVFACGFATFTGVIPMSFALAFFGAGLFIMGIGLLLWNPVKALSKLLVNFIKMFFRAIKRVLVR